MQPFRLAVLCSGMHGGDVDGATLLRVRSRLPNSGRLRPLHAAAVVSGPHRLRIEVGGAFSRLACRSSRGFWGLCGSRWPIPLPKRWAPEDAKERACPKKYDELEYGRASRTRTLRRAGSAGRLRWPPGWRLRPLRRLCPRRGPLSLVTLRRRLKYPPRLLVVLPQVDERGPILSLCAVWVELACPAQVSRVQICDRNAIGEAKAPKERREPRRGH
mmetsp:Transcript_19768/g.54443  ORF Transcript_19768/g.54443 Transcript_19768/m.54443 type:complete len:216 (+) Transcript_19768:469-1116(+)